MVADEVVDEVWSRYGSSSSGEIDEKSAKSKNIGFAKKPSSKTLPG